MSVVANITLTKRDNLKGISMTNSIAISSLTKNMLTTSSVLVHSGLWAWVNATGTCNGFKGVNVQAKQVVVKMVNGLIVCGFKCRKSGVIGAKVNFKSIKELKEFFVRGY